MDRNNVIIRKVLQTFSEGSQIFLNWIFMGETIRTTFLAELYYISKDAPLIVV